MAEAVADPRRREVQRGLVSNTLTTLAQGVQWLLLALLFSILTEWVGMVFWWPEEGLQHSRSMLEAEISYLDSDFRRSVMTSSPAGFAKAFADKTYYVLFEFTGLAEPAAAFHQDGVLWMPGGDRDWADVEQQRMQGFGIVSEVLDDADIAERFPALSSCTLAPDLETGEAHECEGGSRNLFEVEGGHVDPMAAMRDLVEACRNAGVDLRFRSEVIDIGISGGRVRTVSLDNGDEFLRHAESLGRVRLVVSGHVHQVFDERRGGLRVIATPSTCSCSVLA